MYGAMTKQPWRTKGIQNKNKIQVATSPGDCISVDQLESPTPGFIAQLKGKLTKKRYGAATIFVDHASRLSYIHFQQRISSDETVEAKRAFEAYARSHGVTIKHYHANNGRFADNAFMQSVAESGQTISFCGVNAHFQNGIAEKRIRDLSEQARKQLLWNDSAVPTSVQNSETITPSVVQYMHYKINCREEKQSQNGTNEPDSESTSVHRHDMRAQSTFSQWQFISGLIFCLVNETQEGHQDTTSLQTQGKAQCSRWQTSVW
jgi:hypothetical protein